MSQALEMALKAVRDASDAQLKKLYVKRKAEPEKDEDEESKSDELELSDDDMELLQQTLGG